MLADTEMDEGDGKAERRIEGDLVVVEFDARGHRDG